MLISCSSCKSKYLVNSADLKPSGRTVQCAKCGNNWFQTTLIDDELTNNLNQNTKTPEVKKENLPSTFVKPQESSLLNSILVLLLLFFIFLIFWLFKNNGTNFLVLIQFYLIEFYFNLKMIINDISKIIYQIIN